MVRAAILDDGMSDLLVLRRDLEAKRQGYSANSYLQVPRDGLLPIYNRNHIYQQDGAPIHTAKKKNSQKSFEEYAIRLLKNLPPYSPDLKPIEHI